jgi:hypothetical protein
MHCVVHRLTLPYARARARSRASPVAARRDYGRRQLLQRQIDRRRDVVLDPPPGLGEWSSRDWGSFNANAPQKKFWLGFIPVYGWPGYLQVKSAIDARHCRTNDDLSRAARASDTLTADRTAPSSRAAPRPRPRGPREAQRERHSGSRTAAAPVVTVIQPSARAIAFENRELRLDREAAR